MVLLRTSVIYKFNWKIFIGAQGYKKMGNSGSVLPEDDTTSLDNINFYLGKQTCKPDDGLFFFAFLKD